jgi:hypothetical protein
VRAITSLIDRLLTDVAALKRKKTNITRARTLLQPAATVSLPLDLMTS